MCVLFVKVLLEKIVLSIGDSFVVDNYTIHTKGNDIGLQEELFNHHGVLMITLPPLLSGLKSNRVGFPYSVENYNTYTEESFVLESVAKIKNFTLRDVLLFVDKCRYNY